MGSDCCKTRPPEGAGEELGSIMFEGSGFCGCSRPWGFFMGGCCAPAPPTGKEWDEALPGLTHLLEEVDGLCEQAPTCCGSPDLDSLKLILDKDWLPKANEHLGKHNLIADLVRRAPPSLI